MLLAKELTAAKDFVPFVEELVEELRRFLHWLVDGLYEKLPNVLSPIFNWLRNWWAR